MTKSVEDIIEAIDQLDELSNKTLKNYLKHTSETPPKDKYGDLMSGGAAYRAGKTSGDIENPDNLDRKNRNRIRDNQERGRDQASDRIKARETGSTHLDVPHAYSKQGQKYHAELAALKRKHGIDENVIDIIEAIDQLDELSKETLTSYIDKAKDARQKYVGTSVAADLSDGIKKATKKLSNKKLTKESIESLVSAVLDGDQESASAAFSLAMSEKISNRMDSIKQEIASGL